MRLNLLPFAAFTDIGGLAAYTINDSHWEIGRLGICVNANRMSSSSEPIALVHGEFYEEWKSKFQEKCKAGDI